MKSNFKINEKDNSLKESDSLDSLSIDKLNDVNFDDFLKTLPKGWNLWSIRNTSKL